MFSSKILLRLYCIFILIQIGLAGGVAHAAPPDERAGKNATEEKVSTLGIYQGYSQPEYKGFKYFSLYLPMRDGVQLATDVFLPKKAKKGEKFPTIVYLTRYVRSLKAKFPISLFKHPVLVMVRESEINFFTSHGYAVVIVDVRGSGASTGTRTMEFSPEEVKDGAEIVDWIISQPWSNGKVASTGISYVGTTAELLLINQHPAVKACVPRSNIFDLYNHIVFPNGVRQGPFIKIWGKTTHALDHNDFSIFGPKAQKLIKGINPVKGHNGMLKESIAMHASNFDVYAGMLQVNFRNDLHPGTTLCPNDYSIHSNRKAIEESGTAIYRIGGWYDGALCKSVIEGMLNTSNTERVLIGPWDHGPHANTSPYADSKDLNFSVITEILRFLDYHLKGIDNGIGREKKIHYYTVGEEKWKEADSWPLPQQISEPYYLSADGRLVNAPEYVQTGSREYVIDYSVNSGNTSRWNSQTPLYKNGHTHYADRREVSARLLGFTTQPFETEVEITGHIIADLYLSADAIDAAVFCYIEDVGPDSSVTYVTEGMLRALHRKVSTDTTGYRQPGPYHSFNKEDALPLVPGETARFYFDLLPISYQFKAGHALRLSIAGADTIHFDNPDDTPSRFVVSCTEAYPSRIILPVIPKETGRTEIND
ncbi:MAG: putative serine esterase [Chitinophagales bacterium]|nr:MAG: putative serine esterase [Chitinophagales bacterium]